MIADRVSAAVLLAFSVFVIVEARRLPYWTVNAPGPGFLPFWLGVLLVCASIAMMLRTFRRTKAGASPVASRAQSMIRLAAIVALTAAVAVLALFIGLVLASGIFMAAMLAYLRPQHVLANCAVAVLTPAIVWLLFVRWLTVPLPVGPFGF